MSDTTTQRTTVLLLEDSPTYPDDLRAFLGDSKYDMVDRATVAAAVEWLKANPSPSVILIDRTIGERPISPQELAQLRACAERTPLAV